jgi:hypothetical protein
VTRALKQQVDIPTQAMQGHKCETGPLKRTQTEPLQLIFKMVTESTILLKWFILYNLTNITGQKSFGYLSSKNLSDS